MSKAPDDVTLAEPLPYDPVSGETVVGLQKLVGYRLAEWRPDYCRLLLRIGEHHLNRFEGVHGGVYATLADAAAGFSGCFPLVEGERRRCVTLSLTTNFLGQPADGLLVAEGRVRGGGRRVFFSDVEIADGTGTLVCTGSGTFRYRESEPFKA